VIKCLITKIQNSGCHHFENGYLKKYLSRESSKVDEIWYINTNFDFDNRGNMINKSEINIKKSKYNF